jgi:hypothetical protein
MLKESDLKLKGVNLYEDFPLITAKTNSGKTTFSVLELRHILQKHTKREIKSTILITPYRATYKQLLNDKRFVEITEDISSYGCAFFGQDAEKVYVCTYSRLCYLLAKGIDLKDSLLIWDEIHSFVEYTTYQDQMKYLVDFLQNKDLFDTTICVGISGTPQVIMGAGFSFAFDFVDITPSSKSVLKAQKGVIIDHGSIESTVKKLILDDAAKGTLIYVSSATLAIKIKRMYEEKGLNAAFLISKSNQNYDSQSGLTYSQLLDQQVFAGKNIFDWIADESDLPHELDALIIDDAARDGINLLDPDRHFNTVIVESTRSDVIEQVRSRIRHDIDSIYVVFNAKYRERLKSAANDTIKFDIDFNKADRNPQMLIDRYRDQSESIYRAELSRKSYNDDLKDGKATIGRCDQLSLAAYRIEDRYIYNPFARVFAEYAYSGYLEGTGELSTCLKSMIEGNKAFSVIAGSEWIEDLKNKDRLNKIDLIELFHLDVKEEWEITSDQLRKKLDLLDLKNKNRKKLSLAKSIEWLDEHGIFVSKPKRKQVNRIRSTYYTIRRK